MVLRKDNEIDMPPLSSKIEYKLLTRIAPSHYYAMMQCPYKIVLSEAFERRPLIPLSPNAYIGSVFHKLMEKISKGQLTEENFNETWDNEIALKEDELKRDGITFCIPLRNHVQNIGLKKVLIKNQLKVSQNTSINKSKGVEFLSEKWLQNEDGTVGGMADLITKSFSSVSISDFKTGKLTYDMIDESGELVSAIKEEYEYQLKLYAQLYFINYGAYPDYLYLIDMNKNSIKIDFTHEECQFLYKQVQNLLLEVNSNIHKGLFQPLAKCSISNCRYCLYRPACSFYHEWLPANMQTNDVVGRLVKAKQFLNGNINITMEVAGELILIVEIDSSFAVEKYKTGDHLGFYGLKRKNEKMYSMNKYSCIYDVSQQ